LPAGGGHAFRSAHPAADFTALSLRRRGTFFRTYLFAHEARLDRENTRFCAGHDALLFARSQLVNYDPFSWEVLGGRTVRRSIAINVVARADPPHVHVLHLPLRRLNGRPSARK
jgi:hypothetical protein